jgi:putative endopeptidase
MSATPLTSGLDYSYMDGSYRAADDLFLHFNGKWIADYQIPADRASDGVFRNTYDLAEAQVREIIEGATGSDEAVKISDLYLSFMDTEAIKARGISALTADLAEIDGITNLAQFISTMSRFEIQGIGGLTGAAIYADPKNSSMNIFHIGQGGLSLPDEAYYREAEHQPIRDAFVIHVAKMGALAGISLDGHAILNLESAIAAYHWDQVKDRDANATYNKLTLAEFTTLSPNCMWELWFEGAHIPLALLDGINVRQPSFFAGISDLLAGFDSQIDTWKSWLKWNVITASAAYLTDEIVAQNFEFFGTTLSGTPAVRERWKRGVGLVQGSLGEAIGKVYVSRHFSADSKAAMVALVDNLIEAYRQSINDLTWMTDATKAKALHKLSQFRAKIGYPDKWRDYSTLQIDREDLIGNLRRISEFHHAYAVAKLGRPVDLDEWLMTPQTVNAYYMPVMNEIVFPAAILQPPFFNLAADPAANYGAIGAIIGHEIGHGFDDQGSKYDGTGNLVDWWSADDRAAFEVLTSQLIAQYDVLYPASTPDTHVNGAFTVGENIGDLSGLEIAFKAYKISLGRAAAPVIDDLTGEQRFFYAFAQAWRGKNRPEETKRRIAIDPHSPNEFRCNQVVRNLDAFYEAFQVTPSDKLWLDPSERVRIW